MLRRSCGTTMSRSPTSESFPTESPIWPRELRGASFPTMAAWSLSPTGIDLSEAAVAQAAAEATRITLAMPQTAYPGDHWRDAS